MQRDNLDALNELMITSKPPMSALSSAQKTGFTRKYNSQNHPVLFHMGGEPIRRKLEVPAEDREGEIFEEEPDFGADVSEEEGGQEEDENVNQDSLISESKKRKRAPASSSSTGRAKKSRAKK